MVCFMLYATILRKVSELSLTQKQNFKLKTQVKKLERLTKIIAIVSQEAELNFTPSTANSSLGIKPFCRQYYWENAIKLQPLPWSSQRARAYNQFTRLKEDYFSSTGKSNFAVLVLGKTKECWHSLVPLSLLTSYFYLFFSKNNLWREKYKVSKYPLSWFESNDRIVYLFLPQFLSWTLSRPPSANEHFLVSVARVYKSRLQ